MAQAEQTKPRKPGPQPSPRKADEDPVGKVYDSRLMRRLARYIGPYWVQATIASIAVILKSVGDVAGPFLLMVGIDHYFPASPDSASVPLLNSFSSAHWLTRYLSSNPVQGITQLAAIYLALLISSFLLEFLQIYLMQWTGQKIMFDLRRDIFRHLQRMYVGFFDPIPSAASSPASPQTSTPSTTCLPTASSPSSTTASPSPSWPASCSPSSGGLPCSPSPSCPSSLSSPASFATTFVRATAASRAAIARINSFTQEYIMGMSVVQLFNREQRAYDDFKVVNEQHMVAFKDTIFAYALYYPAVEILSSIAIALVVWRGGFGVIAQGSVTIGVLASFICTPCASGGPFRT